MKIPYDKEWILLEREDYANYLFVVNSWEGYTYMPREWGFADGHYMGAEYINSACNLFTLKSEHDKINKINFQLLFNKPAVWDRLHRITIVNSNKLFSFGNTLLKINPSRITNKEIFNLLKSFTVIHGGAHIPRGPMWELETPDNTASEYLQKYLEEKVEDAKTKIKPNEAFQIMIAPLKKSIWTKEKEKLAKIGLIENKAKQEKKLIMHAKKFEWLEYGLQGKILDLDYFKAELSKLKKRGCTKVLKDIQKEFDILEKQQAQIIKEYKIHKVHQKIFKIVQDSMFTRLYSKDAQFFGYYCLENLFREVGKRTGLTIEQSRFLAPHDYKELLINKKDYGKITDERPKYSLHISDKGKTKFYLGENAKKIRKKLKFYEQKAHVRDAEILKGQPAYNGKARGRVKIINTIPEIAKIHQGNILVSHMTNPGIVPAMKQAAAIVTDLGGITCHAAIVSRELKKPCVIGTRIATQILKDGDEVEVNADKGEIRIVKS